MRPHVVLLPGLGLDERAWARVRSSLPSPTTVVRLPAMGTRPAPGTGVSVDALAGALSSALDAATGADPVVLVGLSASCPVAVETARRDHRVAGLVLVGPVTDPRGRTWPPILGTWVRTAGHERLREVPVLAPQYLRTGLVRSVLRGMDRIRWYDTDSALAAVTVPVTLVRGEHDHIAPRSWVDRLARAGGHHAVATVAGGGHLVPLTHPEAVARAIQDIVARRGVAGPTPPPGPPRPDADGC